MCSNADLHVEGKDLEENNKMETFSNITDGFMIDIKDILLRKATNVNSLELTFKNI
jgi:hypothetical protein